MGKWTYYARQKLSEKVKSMWNEERRAKHSVIMKTTWAKKRLNNKDMGTDISTGMDRDVFFNLVAEKLADKIMVKLKT